MSVPAGPTFVRYTANGVATVYTIPFLVLDAADLQITLNGTLVTSGFVLSGVGNPTSTCTFTAAPTGDLLFQQNVPFQRLNDYQVLGDFMASTVNRDFDRLWLAVKQLSGGNSRALTVSPLEPEGIPPIPLKAARALRVLAFNAGGDPVVSNLTLQQLEEQPALALASAQAAAASAGQSAGSASAASASAAAAAASASSVTGAAVPMFSVTWWGGNRAAIPAGYVPADGQTLSRALYPDAWTAINAGNMPVAADATWLSTAAERGKYTAGNGTTTFRVPDYNGATAGSIAATFQRGDAGGLLAGLIKQDQMQVHKHRLTQGYFNDATGNLDGGATTDGTVSTYLANGLSTGVRALSGVPYAGVSTNGIGGGARAGDETFPTHVVGCFIIKLFGAVTNQGAADAALLATELATLTANFQNSRAGSFANTFLAVEDRKATNVAGGTATASTWTTRDLNSVRVNRITGASVASNQVTLPAGTYRFEARAPAIGVGSHQIRLRNITDAADVDTGSSGFSISSALNAQTDSVISGEFTIAATKVFEIQHNVAVTRATNGFGAAANLGTTEIYTQAKFWRLA